jgi:hypothetical protein
MAAGWPRRSVGGEPDAEAHQQGAHYRVEARRTRAIPARRPEIIALRVTIAKSGPGDIEAGTGVL